MKNLTSIILEAIMHNEFTTGHYLVKFPLNNTFERGIGKVSEGPFGLERAKEIRSSQSTTGQYLGAGQEHELLFYDGNSWHHTHHETSEPIDIAHRTVSK